MTRLALVHETAGAAEAEASVLMPVYNSATMVGEAIESVLSQADCRLDILVSDDRSGDGTFEAARQTVEAYRGPHRVRLFQAVEHLGIDHLHELVDRAACRLLIEAHGDDVSHPGRMARLVAIHRETRAALIVSLCDRRDEPAGLVTPERPPAGMVTGWVGLEQCVPPEASGLLAGARYAFDRVIHDDFPRLDSARAPSSHDRIQAFRAALLGRLWFTEERLLQCRRHAGQASRGLVDRQSALSMQFGWSLRHLAAIRAMQEDLKHAKAHDLIQEKAAKAARRLLARRAKGLRAELLDSRDALVRSGLQPVWVSGEELMRRNASKPAGS